MAASYFQFKQFTIHQEHCSMKVTTDACLLGAWAAAQMNGNFYIKNILDIGAGTGLLSLMLAQQTPAAIDGIELQEKDYLQSLKNIAASPWYNQINIIHADAKNFSFNKKYDAVISNPPFYENDLKGSGSGKNVAHHDDGLTLKQLIRIIATQLSDNGKFFVLLPEKRKDDLLRCLQNSGLFAHQIISVHQTEKHGAFRLLVQGGFKPKELKEESIIIKNRGAYSACFCKLLQPYYLQL